MRPLAPEELLAVWEHALNQPLLKKTLRLLKAASPETDIEELSRLSIGQRDARLLQLREWMFGARLLNTAQCTGCSERIEWESDVRDFKLQPIKSSNPDAGFSLEKESFSLRYRLPDSNDLAWALSCGERQRDSEALLRRCIIDCRKSGEAWNSDKLPATVINELIRQIESRDPQADIRILLTCPGCALKWETVFDICGYLWAEINRWAARILQTVHRLATAYGWSERDILNMSPAKRQIYISMVS